MYIPGLLLFVAVLESFKGKERSTPGEGGDDVFVGAKDVKGATNVGASPEVGKNAGCIIRWWGSRKHAARGFKELGLSEYICY